jgi:hypothetical protein
MLIGKAHRVNGKMPWKPRTKAAGKILNLPVGNRTDTPKPKPAEK